MVYISLLTFQSNEVSVGTSNTAILCAVQTVGLIVHVIMFMQVIFMWRTDLEDQPRGRNCEPQSPWLEISVSHVLAMLSLQKFGPSNLEKLQFGPIPLSMCAGVA